MNNYKLLIQYDGTKYSGWQKQGNTSNTICGKIEEVLSKLFNETIELQGSGRTDAGVHAKGQVANFHCTHNIACNAIVKYSNQYLPEDIRILEAALTDSRFHSRLNARCKTYTYRIDNSVIEDVFSRKYAYHIAIPLDIAAMKEAAASLIGTYDFVGFSSLKRVKKSTVRTIYSIDINVQHNMIAITYKGDGFLYNMVRILSGTLVEVGLGHISPSYVPNIIKSCDRQLAGPTLPPQGLYLMDVTY